jgi:hypothetical protein
VTGQRRIAGGSARLVVLAVVVLGWIPGQARAAGAAEADDGVRPSAAYEVSGQYLTVTSATAPEFLYLKPGTTAVWDLGIAVDAPEAGEVVRSLTARGDLASVPGALSLAVWSCDQPTVEGSCRGRSDLVLPPTPMTDLTTAPIELGRQSSDEKAWLSVHVTVSPDVDPTLSGRATLVFGASGTSVGGTTGSPPSAWGGLAHTGTELGRVLVLALGSVAAGLVLAGLARRHHREVVS